MPVSYRVSRQPSRDANSSWPKAFTMGSRGKPAALPKGNPPANVVRSGTQRCQTISTFRRFTNVYRTLTLITCLSEIYFSNSTASLSRNGSINPVGKFRTVPCDSNRTIYSDHRFAYQRARLSGWQSNDRCRGLWNKRNNVIATRNRFGIAARRGEPAVCRDSRLRMSASTRGQDL